MDYEADRKSALCEQAAQEGSTRDSSADTKRFALLLAVLLGGGFIATVAMQVRENLGEVWSTPRVEDTLVPCPTQAATMHSRTPREDQLDPAAFGPALRHNQPQGRSVSPPLQSTLSLPAIYDSPGMRNPAEAHGQRRLQQEFLWRIARRVGPLRYSPLGDGSNRAEGTVVARITLDRAGNLLDAGIVRSSGLQSIDRRIVSSIRRAAPYPPPPPQIVGDWITLHLPLHFEYTDRH